MRYAGACRLHGDGATAPEMTLNEHQLRTALDAALHQIRTTLTAVAARVAEGLGTTVQSGGAIVPREVANSAQFDLRRNLGTLHQVFADELARRIAQDLAAPREAAARTPTATSWQTLTLVDDHEMEERMLSDRIGQQISHACESELRDLAGYIGALLQSERAEPDRNPLRAEVIGAALYRAIEAASPAPELRTLLARELGAAMAVSMPACYAQILQLLRDRGVQPMELRVRQVEGPGNLLPGLNSAYATLSSTRSQQSEFDASLPSHLASTAGGYARDGRSISTGSHSLSGPSTSDSRSARSGPSSRSGLNPSQADAQLTALLRHLSAVASGPGALEALAPRDSRPISLSNPRFGSARFDAEAPASAASPPYAGNGLTGLMAVNLIRAHREELRQASSGKLDHMVIDVVGSLFDQILSDSRVPPQMARQIARLQLPVLRVALNDSSFFSSRRHPVRRFVNRIASLACAFDDFDDGPGKHFLDRVRELVQEIVEGDFDQIELYDAKLAELEGFIAEQTHGDALQQGTISTLGGKETELRLQQRYMLQLQAALTPLQVTGWLRDFLAQVWSQALVLAVSRDGATADRAVRYRRVARDLVMSVQPKGSPPLRKKFLMLLPPLMKDLNEGLALVGWPEAAQREFFSRLLPAHAESLKPPQSELDHNMLVKQLEGIFATPVPGNESISPADPALEVDADVIATRFSPEEAKSVGFVSESAVDWSGVVDIDLNDEASAGAAGESGADSTDAALPDIDIDIGLSSAEPAEPTRGPQLMDHIKLGFAYQMHLKDEWQKVRLAHVSAARSFFVFTRGSKHQETISVTARMLVRMCETNRFQAVESAYLIERATLRARKQLAALGAQTRH